MSCVFLSKWLSGTFSKVRLFPYILAVLSAFTGITFHCSADSAPELFLPFGSYLEHVFLNRIYITNGNFYYGTQSGRPIKLSFYSSGSITDAESCWTQGYDLKALSAFELTCDTSQRKKPINVADSLNSVLVPYGSYLDSCKGVIKIKENNRSYLYSSCQKVKRPLFGCIETAITLMLCRENSFPNKLVITDCIHGAIANEGGRLTCQKNSVYSRRILSGTYLQQCKITDTYYYEDTQWLATVCDEKLVSKDVSNDCLGSGRDIIYQNGSLQCIESGASNVEIHVASPYLPPGNYLLTCQQQAFYPCLGHNRKGRLVAECQKESGALVSASLEDGDSPCRMDQLGYVANKNGVLVCDPSYEFNDEDPTVGTDLMHTFQCNE